MTDFLYDDKTKKIMGDACQEFVDYKVEFEDENKEFYIEAKTLVQTKDQLESQIQDVLEQPDDMQDEFEADKRTDY